MLRTTLITAALLVTMPALAQGPAASSLPDVNPEAKRLLQPEIVAVTMRAEPTDVEVLVNRRPIEKKLLPEPIFMPWGTHSFEAKKDGLREASQRLALLAGADVGVPLKLVAVDGGQGVAGDPGNEEKKPPPPPPPPPRDRIRMYLGAGMVSVIALSIGIEAAIDVNRFHDLEQEALSKSCVSDCERRHDAYVSTRVALAYTSLFAFVVAGAAVGGVTLVDVLSQRPKPADTKEPTRASLVVAPTLGGFIVQGRW